jgi:hypothetical protein
VGNDRHKVEARPTSTAASDTPTTCATAVIKAVAALVETHRGWSAKKRSSSVKTVETTHKLPSPSLTVGSRVGVAVGIRVGALVGKLTFVKIGAKV